NGAGSGGVGGMERAIHGKGLVASAMVRAAKLKAAADTVPAVKPAADGLDTDR
ncbi:MAG: hypothetical protein HC883_02665, partial [Bdellovibrionaceae bacterium]|nr:hypothetical protein [Pseudobdellovibrionaceae bacterium]